MTYRVIFSADAVNDLRAILKYISDRNHDRGHSFVRTLRDRIAKKLSIFPESGTKIGRHRVAVFGSYVAVYAFDRSDGLVRIAMVTEAHRNWRAMFDDPA